MDTTFELEIAGKSDSELEAYLIDVKKHNSTTIKLALNELQKRGKEFTALQLEYIESVVKTKVQEEWRPGSTKSRYTRNVVTDIEAPSFYSQTAIMVFSMLFGVIFGATMMTINIKNKTGKWIVIGVGISFLVCLMVLSNFITLSGPIIIGINAIGGALLTEYFWKKYIGENTRYRAKAIWIPLIITLTITIPLVFLAIYYGE